MAEKLPVIIDNRGENKVLRALQKLLPHLQKMDIATGVFEIGSFLLLEGLWQELDKIRILMGDETTRRTKREIVQALLDVSNESIEREKERDDALTGLAAVRQAIGDKQIALRTYSKAKFHAKSYLMESKVASPVDFAIVGSSNFSRPGLTENVELNLFSTDQVHIENLRKWYDELWKEGEDVKEEILKVIEPHLKEYDPFTVYAKALYEFFAGREKTQDEWELTESVLYRKLSQYQRDGYHQALKIADRWNGALVCDGVGLGKTFIGLMILERCLREKRQALLVVPKSTEQSVWRANIDRYLKPHYPRAVRHYIDYERHTSFGRPDGIKPEDLDFYRKNTEVIVIDEAHHFRNPRANRGKLFMELAGGKKLYMLTATPINNSLDDCRGVQDLKSIGQRIVHAAAFTEAPVNLGSNVAEGSTFKNGEITLELKGLSRVAGAACAMVNFDSGECSFKMTVKPMPDMEVRTVGSSHYKGDIYIDLLTNWVKKVTMDELVVAETTLPMPQGKANAVIERNTVIRNVSAEEFARR
ncbi:MAG TPA: SNF2-related protein [Sedimentisphaerales bacterium]|nr:SNF2-related protein [Sedimentisphaerales bacterium]